MIRALTAACVLFSAVPAVAQNWHVTGDRSNCTAERGSSLAITWERTLGHQVFVRSALLTRSITPIGSPRATLAFAFDVNPEDSGDLTRSADWTAISPILPSGSEAAILQSVPEAFVEEFARARQMFVLVDGEVAVVSSLRGSGDAVSRLRTCIAAVRGDRRF